MAALKYAVACILFFIFAVNCFTGTNAETLRFKNNGDETITDTKTGLMWTKNAYPAGIEMTWADAGEFVKTVTIGGYSDWRLPAKDELISIRSACPDSIIQSGKGGEWFMSQGFVSVHTSYWSSTSMVGPIVPAAWYVSMCDSRVDVDLKANQGNVWPVRSAQSQDGM